MFCFLSESYDAVILCPSSHSLSVTGAVVVSHKGKNMRRKAFKHHVPVNSERFGVRIIFNESSDCFEVH